MVLFTYKHVRGRWLWVDEATTSMYAMLCYVLPRTYARSLGLGLKEHTQNTPRSHLHVCTSISSHPPHTLLLPQPLSPHASRTWRQGHPPPLLKSRAPACTTTAGLTTAPLRPSRLQGFLGESVSEEKESQPTVRMWESYLDSRSRARPTTTTTTDDSLEFPLPSFLPVHPSLLRPRISIPTKRRSFSHSHPSLLHPVVPAAVPAAARPARPAAP